MEIRHLILSEIHGFYGVASKKMNLKYEPMQSSGRKYDRLTTAFCLDIDKGSLIFTIKTCIYFSHTEF